MAADRGFERCAVEGEPARCLEGLGIGMDDRDQRNGTSTDLRRQFHEPVEDPIVSLGSQTVTPDRGEAVFLLRMRSRQHLELSSLPPRHCQPGGASPTS